MKRMMMTVVAAGTALAAVAMPTKAELQKAQEMVSDVTAADVAALKAKTKTPAEVAAKHMELAGQSSSEAEKYLLLQAAFKLYAKAGDYDAAANVIEKLQAEITDYNPEVTVELCGAEFIRKMRENAPRLYALKENARRIVFYRKQLPIREAAVKKNPKDAQAQRKLAECHAELGDWPKALEVFVKAGGEFKKMAEGETSGKIPAQELGDFWWDYETKSDTAVYKLHAAELYRTALADNSFKGLARTRAEQRVKEVAGNAAAVTADGQGASPRAPGANGLYCVIDLSGGPNAKKYPVTYLNDMPKGGWSDEYKTTKLVLRRIEPGAFRMGPPDKSQVAKIKVPFYMGVFEVSQKQWSLVMGDRPAHLKGEHWFLRPVEKVSYERIRGKDAGSKWPESDEVDADSFMGLVRQKTRLRFDLPTKAQWEYACRAGTETDFYNNTDQVSSSKDVSLDKIGRYQCNGGWDDEKWGKFNWGKVWTVPERNCETNSGTAALGSYQPNNWGLYDMLGNVREWCLEGDGGLGGCWWDYAKECKVYSSQSFPRQRGRQDYGLRLCLPLAGGAAAQASAATPTTGSIELETGGASPFTVKGNEALLKLPNGEVIEFVRCPTGKFRMFRGQGASSDVTISRAFWMSKTPLTGKAAANAVGQDEKVRGRYCAFGSQFGSEKVISWLRNSYSSFLPKGAVLRQPSIAELQYAFCANGKSADATYNLFTKNEDVKVKIFCDYKGERKTAPNAWGFYDFSGLEYVLDRIDASSVTSWEHKENGKMRMLPEPSNMTDAFYWTDADVSTQYIVHRDVWWCSKNIGGPFHIVIGPDLVSEWKAKNGKK